MKTLTKDEILKDAKKNNVHYIRLQCCDLLGTVKNVEIPYSMLENALDNKTMFDGSSFLGFARLEEADMYLYPDLNTWKILTYDNDEYGTVARLICDVYLPDGTPYKADPRYILKQNMAKLNDLGFSSFNIGVEPEFYLFKMDADEPTLIPNDEGGYFDMSPVDNAVNCRRDIVIELEKLGFNVEAAHHEVGDGQNEINFTFCNALEASDNLLLFKNVVKVIAKRHGFYASFLPKPIEGAAGNGMHVNCSLSDKDGKNAFYDASKDNGLSDVCLKWISGILKNAREFAALTNPIVNSYKRLVPGYEAPCYISWSSSNRSSLIRIPATRGKTTRTELRCPDPTCNPYVAFSAILASGLDGIKNDIDIIPEINVNLFNLDRDERTAIGVYNLPENLKDAVKELKSSDLMKENLGEEFVSKYCEIKRKEWDKYRCHVSTWEIAEYFGKY